MKYILHYLSASAYWNLIPVKQNLLRDQCSVCLWIQLNILETDYQLTGICELICLSVHPMDQFQRNFAQDTLGLKRRFISELHEKGQDQVRRSQRRWLRCTSYSMIATSVSCFNHKIIHLIFAIKEPKQQNYCQWQWQKHGCRQWQKHGCSQ